MRQGWKLLMLCAALAAMTVAATPSAHAAKAKSVAKSSAPETNSKARRSLRQFTGVVVALDKSSITVEKSGKKPKTMVFSRHAEMKTTGDLDEDARVTVYYRDEGGNNVAHRVVVKAETASSDGGR
jgi:hypothetical protein